MIIVPATTDSEGGVLPTEVQLADMTTYNEEMLRAGVFVAGEGLHPSSRGARVSYPADGEMTVTDGPFAEAKELIAGFTMI
ncbi:MAG: YciI family protein, partial [Terracoccus sp.]